MGHGKHWGGDKPDGIKTQNMGRGIPEHDSGFCKLCGEFDTELAYGYCRDEKCKRGRQLLALAEGRAVYANDRGMWSYDKTIGAVRQVK